jgi:hypothetical protein
MINSIRTFKVGRTKKSGGADTLLCKLSQASQINKQLSLSNPPQWET